MAMWVYVYNCPMFIYYIFFQLVPIWDIKHKSQTQNLKVKSLKNKLKTSLHKTQCPNGDKLKEEVVNKNRTIVQVYSHRHFYRFFMSPSRRLAHRTQNTKAKTQNLVVKSLKHKTKNILTQNTMSLISIRTCDISIFIEYTFSIN